MKIRLLPSLLPVMRENAMLVTRHIYVTPRVTRYTTLHRSIYDLRRYRLMLINGELIYATSRRATSSLVVNVSGLYNTGLAICYHAHCLISADCRRRRHSGHGIAYNAVVTRECEVTPCRDTDNGGSYAFGPVRAKGVMFTATSAVCYHCRRWLRGRYRHICYGEGTASYALVIVGARNCYHKVSHYIDSHEMLVIIDSIVVGY